MVTIYPFKGLHPSAEAFKTVPSVPYDVIERDEAAAEIAENPNTLLRVIRTDAELLDTDPYVLLCPCRYTPCRVTRSFRPCRRIRGRRAGSAYSRAWSVAVR